MQLNVIVIIFILETGVVPTCYNHPLTGTLIQKTDASFKRAYAAATSTVYGSLWCSASVSRISVHDYEHVYRNLSKSIIPPFLKRQRWSHPFGMFTLHSYKIITTFTTIAIASRVCKFLLSMYSFKGRHQVWRKLQYRLETGFSTAPETLNSNKYS